MVCGKKRIFKTVYGYHSENGYPAGKKEEGV